MYTLGQSVDTGPGLSQDNFSVYEIPGFWLFEIFIHLQSSYVNAMLVIAVMVLWNINVKLSFVVSYPEHPWKWELLSFPGYIISKNVVEFCQQWYPTSATFLIFLFLQQIFQWGEPGHSVWTSEPLRSSRRSSRRRRSPSIFIVLVLLPPVVLRFSVLPRQHLLQTHRRAPAADAQL